jgi:4-carboxymuconolactone decarboxylase
MRNRRKVLGEAYVDRALKLAKNDDFTAPLQDMVTEFGWGAIWGRPGLDHKTRSLITVGMLIALNRRHEVALHVRGALNNGVSRLELQELLLHAGCYCGWPASVDAFRIVQEVFAELKKGMPRSTRAVRSGGKRSAVRKKAR